MKKRLAVLLAGLFSFGLISIANATPVTIQDPGMDYGLGRYMNYDILSMTGSYDSNNVYISFLLDQAPGVSGDPMISPPNAFCAFLGIDTDRNPLTGSNSISAYNNTYPVEAKLEFCMYNGSSIPGFGSAGYFLAPVSISGSQVSVTIPFSSLGISSGPVDMILVAGNSPYESNDKPCRIYWGEEISDIARGTTGPVSGSSPVPEPASILLLGSGLIGMMGVARKKS